MNRLVCVLKSGGVYKKEDVLVLASAVKSNSATKPLIICLNDIYPTKQMNSGVLWLPFVLKMPGWWGKLELLRPTLDQFRPFVFLDLDTAVLNNIDWLFGADVKTKVGMLRDFHTPSRPASGIMTFPARGILRPELWDDVVKNHPQIMETYKRGGDQAYFGSVFKSEELYFLQDAYPNQIFSYKPTREKRLNVLPEGCSIVCFHGVPKPRDAQRESEWVAQYYDLHEKCLVEPNLMKPNLPEVKKVEPVAHKSPTCNKLLKPMDRYSGTLIVLGSGEGGLEDLLEVKKFRPQARVATIGHAAKLVQADFLVSDHYEIHKELIQLQQKFHTNFTTHCSFFGAWRRYPEIDCLWDWERADASSAQTAIRIGLSLGFDEIILCGCPLSAGRIQIQEQQRKDGTVWPPPRDIKKHGFSTGNTTSDEILQNFRRNFTKYVDGWYGKVFSMSGFTKQCLGAPVLERGVSILCPTRGRPELAKRMIDSVHNTSTKSVEVLLYVDENDPFVEDYKKLTGATVFVEIPCENVGKAWNVLAKRASGKFLMMGNDDLVFRTNGWDALLECKVEMFPDSIFVAWFDDGTKDVPHRCAFPIVSRKWYNTLGFFTPECFHFLWNDTYVHDIGKRVNRELYMPEALVEHMHFTQHKSEMDDTYAKHRLLMDSKRKRKEDEEMFKTTAPVREEAAQKLRDVMVTTRVANGTKVGFVGLGKLGLPVAVCMDMCGHHVVGYDVNPLRMSRDRQPYKEAGPDGFGDFNDYLQKSSVEFGNIAAVVKHAEIVFVAVQTPHQEKYEGITRIPDDRVDFDYTYLKEAVSKIAQEAKVQQKEIIIDVISTCLPGTMRREIFPLLNDYTTLVYNPYFIAMGTTMRDFFNCEFVLIGSECQDALDKMREFYATITKAPVQTMRIESAEATKVCYNTYITMKICFANMIMEMSHKTAANCEEIIGALKKATTRLISTAYMNGGMGDSGGCHPRDCIAMSWFSNELGLKFNLFDALMECRENQTDWLADLIMEQVKETGLPVGILGYTFKPETSLTIGSCAILLQNLLKERGVDPMMVDAHVKPNDKMRKAAVWFVGCKHPEYATITFPEGSVVIDPFRYIQKQENSKVIPIGIGR